MPRAPKTKVPPPNSTERRKTLATFIEVHGEIMPRKCNHCVKDQLVCKVHVKSGRCGNCNDRGHNDCNVRVTEAEWRRLKVERSKLLDEIEAAREATSKALAKERRLMKQLELLDKRSDDAVALQEAQAQEQEVEEFLAEVGSTPPGSELALQPDTWSAMDGIPDEHWYPLMEPSLPSVSSAG
jgi:hypothetical protein